MKAELADVLGLLAGLCSEAAAVYGDDVTCIELHVEAAIEKLPAAQRASLRKAISAFLRTQVQMQNQTRRGRLVN